MRVKKILAVVTVLLTFCGQLPAYSATMIKIGTLCKNKNEVRTLKNKQFKCIQVGKKLSWQLIPVKKISEKKEPEKTSEIPTEQVSQGPPEPQKPFERNPKYKIQGQSCVRNSGDVIGYNLENELVYLMCNSWDDKYFPRPDAPKLDQETLVPTKSVMGSMNPSIVYVAPKPLVGAPKTEITPTVSLGEIQKCKIRDGSFYRVTPSYTQHHFTSGFPNYPERANFQNKGILQIVPVDFPDLQGKRSPAEDLSSVTKFMTEFFSRQASMPIDFKIRVPEKYFRMPKAVADYDLAVDFFSGKWTSSTSFNYAREAIRVTDPHIDFSGASMMAIVVPAEVTRSEIGAFVAQSGEPGQQFYTNEGGIYNLLIMAGPTGGEEAELLNWTHETAHLFGLTDIRGVDDVSQQDSSALGVFDLMNSAIAPELLGWQRFILGILNENQVRCVNSTTATTHHLIPIAQPDLLPKLVVIPISDYKAIAVESRRRHGYDMNLGSRNEGVVVYEIDTTIPYGKSTMKLIPSPTSVDSKWRRDGALVLDEYVTAHGWKITYVESGAYGDVVRVEKIG